MWGLESKTVERLFLLKKNQVNKKKEQKKTREKWVGGDSCTRTQLHWMNICVKTILAVRKMLDSNGNSDVESFWGNRWQALRSSGFSICVQYRAYTVQNWTHAKFILFEIIVCFIYLVRSWLQLCSSKFKLHCQGILVDKSLITWWRFCFNVKFRFPTWPPSILSHLGNANTWKQHNSKRGCPLNF